MVNSDWREPAPSPEWSAVTLDITSAATTAGDGTMDVSFGHMADLAADGTCDVDHVSIYTCAAPPSSGYVVTGPVRAPST